MMETIARILALRLSHMDREMADFAANVAREHPAASSLTDGVASNRARLMHEWNF